MDVFRQYSKYSKVILEKKWSYHVKIWIVLESKSSDIWYWMYLSTSKSTFYIHVYTVYDRLTRYLTCICSFLSEYLNIKSNVMTVVTCSDLILPHGYANHCGLKETHLGHILGLLTQGNKNRSTDQMHLHIWDFFHLSFLTLTWEHVSKCVT